jgi:anthranilate synthase component II
MRVLVIDNYDSFTYNIVQALGAMGHDITVFRNDQVTPDQVAASGADRLIISPGPCTPAEAGVSCAVIDRMKGRVPILGVCLGHQAIAHVFGATVGRAQRLMHGKTSPIHHKGVGVFRGLPSPFDATRYHSLIAYEQTLPDCLEVTAWTEDVSPREVMGVRHKNMAIEGVQFHPESFLTKDGPRLLANFMEQTR